MTLLTLIDHVRQDLRYAWRGLQREPAFATMVVATIALGVGVNTAMFTLLDRMFVQPPRGLAAPAQVRRLYLDSKNGRNNTRVVHDNFKYVQVRAIAEAVGPVLLVGAYSGPDSANFIRGEERIPIREATVTGNYFDVLGLRPQLGRFFLDDERRIEVPTPVVVLSDVVWRARFDADPNVLGRTVSIDFRPYTVIGVAPRDFTGLDLSAVDAWLPANTYPSNNPSQRWYEGYQNSFQAIARVVTAADDGRLRGAGGAAYRAVRIARFGFDTTATLITGPVNRAVGPAKRSQEMTIATRLGVVTLIVLIIATANVANLLLVRATRRRRELAVRTALGASAGRILIQLLTESLLLAMIGCGAALLLAFWAGSAMRRLLLPGVQWASSPVDLRSFIVAATSAILVGVIAALAAGLRNRRDDLSEPLKAGGREGGVERSRLRDGLLVLQAALSVILVVGATLFARSLENVRSIELGFDADRVSYAFPIFAVTKPPAREIGLGLKNVAQRLAGAPGIEAVATASTPPMRGYSAGFLRLPDRDSIPRLGRDGYPAYISISPSYFKTVGVRMLAGREFDEHDVATAGGAVIVSQTMARVFWPGENAIGKCLIVDSEKRACSNVIGVVCDVHRMNVIENPVMQYYLPLNFERGEGPSYLVYRLAAGPGHSKTIVDELKREFPTMTTPRLRPMTDSIEPEFRPWRLGAVLFGAFAVLALVVAAVGVFSVVSYSVSQRFHEMGVRMALGAHKRQILDLIISGSVRTVALGVVLGSVIAAAGGRLIQSMLFGVTARDPFAFLGAAAALCAVAIVASTIPAWQVARIDPMEALRTD
jgi:predicted permease